MRAVFACIPRGASRVSGGMSTQAGRVALVTGTSTGFGRLTAEALARAGYRTYGTLRDGVGRNAAAKAALESAGVRVVEMDVTEDASVEGALSAVVAEAGAVDVLVNNAGAAYFGYVEAFTPEFARKQFEVNVFGPLRVNRAILPGMRERGRGLVVYVSSIVGRFAIPFGGIYASSKWALEALAEASACELRPFGIDVAIVEPGAFTTNIGAASVVADDAAVTAAYERLKPSYDGMMQGLADAAGDAQEVADAILALARSEAGRRPLRTVVGADGDGARAINTAVAPIQRGIMEAIGVSALLPPEPLHV